MSYDPSSIGMMEGAFFVPKTDLLQWVNATLDLNVTKIQQLGTGAVYCQILDVMFPGKVAMQRVNWKARNEWQFINNLKILQQGFSKCKINKHIEIEKLSKSKYQDNLQFIQWMKRYFDLAHKQKSQSQQKYDAKNARKNASVDFSFVQMRNPKRKARQSATLTKGQNRSLSPGSKVKIRNNRSSTLEKNVSNLKNVKSQHNYYFNKLQKIKQIIKKENKNDHKISQIQQILQEIQEEISPKIHEKIPTIPSIHDDQVIAQNIIVDESPSPQLKKKRKQKNNLVHNKSVQKIEKSSKKLKTLK